MPATKAGGSVWKRRLIIALGCVIAYALLGFLAAPALLRWQGEIRLGELLQREVKIESVAINPFLLTLDVGGFSVRPTGADGDDAEFEQLHADLELESIIRGGPVLRELRLTKPLVRVALLDDERNNWSDVIERLASKPDEPSGETRFAVNNIRLDDGRVELEDKPRGTTHTIDKLSIGLPFISNLPSKVSIFVEPMLSAVVDGALLEMTGRSVPFSETRETQLDFKFQDLELAQYMPYLPFEPRFKMKAGKLGSTLEISFSQPVSGAPQLSISGGLTVTGLDVQALDGRSLIAAGGIAVDVEDVSPLQRRFVLRSLTVDEPVVAASRDSAGRIDLQDLLPPAEPAGVANAEVAETAAPAQAEGVPVDFRLGELRVQKGAIAFSDRVPAKPFDIRLTDVTLEATGLSLAKGSASPLKLSANSDLGLKLGAEGQFTPSDGGLDLQATIDGARLAAFAPYYGGAIHGGAVDKGVVDAAVHLSIPEGDATRLTVSDGRIAIKDFALQAAGAKRPPIAVGVLEAAGISIDMSARKASIARISSSGARIEAVRLADGSFDLPKLFSDGDGAGKTAAKPEPAQQWLFESTRVELKDWTLRLDDRTSTPHSQILASKLELGIDGLSSRPGSALKLSLNSRINRRGQLQASGTVVAAPFATDLKLKLKGLDLLPLQQYVTEKVNVIISGGSLSANGRLKLASARDGSVRGGYTGDAAVNGFASVDKLNSTDFVRWGEFGFDKIDLALAPFALSVGEVRLKDFYSRLILDASGKLNLREIAGEDTGATPQENGQKGQADPGKSPPIRIDRIVFEGGNVAFSDHFIRPNYDANLTGLAGALEGLSSDSASLARLDLKGRVDGAAPVSISGVLNPFREDRALDIKAEVKSFDLSAVSAYSGKYVGYGIRKGKLSAKLNYKIEDRKLSATNNIFLDQLTFGEPVESPDAIKAPVLLAVALLKNGRGEIDLDLPISGTLDDPQFSIGGLVFRAIMNLLGKAITAPFALLGSMFGGGGEELAWLAFEPGRAVITEKGTAKLETLAKALKNRPALKLEISSHVDPQQDPDGLRKAALERELKAVKLKRLVREGKDAPSLEGMVINPAEYGDLLTAVYKDAKFDRPRNFVGLLKDQPVPEMERMLLEHIKPGEEGLRQLAQRRVNAVRQWLIETGEVEPERLFEVAGAAGRDGELEDAPAARVDFSLK